MTSKGGEKKVATVNKGLSVPVQEAAKGAVSRRGGRGNSPLENEEWRGHRKGRRRGKKKKERSRATHGKRHVRPPVTHNSNRGGGGGKKDCYPSHH